MSKKVAKKDRKIMGRYNHELNEFCYTLEAFMIDHFELETSGLTKEIRYVDEKANYNISAHKCLVDNL